MKLFNVKKLTALLFSMVIVVFSAVGVGAEGSYCYDNELIFSEDEYQTLSSELSQVSDLYECNVAVITSETFSTGSVVEDAEIYAADFDRDGYDGTILFLVSATQREYAITATDDVGVLFNEETREAIESSVLDYLKDEDYYSASMTFAQECESYLKDFEENGYAYNSGDTSLGLFDYAFYLLIALVIGFLIALIVVLVMKGQLKSVRFEAQANNYIKEDSFKLTERRDTFLYSKVDRRAKPKQTTSSGSSASRGGSGSGGTTSGKF